MSTKSILALSLLLSVHLAPRASAADLVVTVSGVKEAKGKVACALFRSADGFPMDPTKATGLRIPAQVGSVECKFEKLEPGSYAVSVSVDRNENGKTDKNFLGIPTEPWGVSNNVRPSMRPPRFAEAVFQIQDQSPLRMEVKVSQ